MTTPLLEQRPVIPRPAASLVIYEKKQNDIYVLMGRRAKAHRFLPNVYVFPGGRVDAADAMCEPLAPLPEHVARRLSRPAGMAHAVATAAVRETHEETGLVIGDIRNGALVPDLSNLDYIARAITPPISPIRFNTRFLSIDARHVTGTLQDSRELIDLQWVTLTEALKMPLVDVTEFVLGEIGRRVSTSAQTTSAPAGIPLFRYIKGKPRIRSIDHD
ncbi:NUDIX domain-containing protein [Sneathiella sp.]|uniref:NUDIX hydrolase n=1 Tax=Sneathiella sp. TaxID=1964365 RepID=UPI0035680FAA